MHEIYLLNVCSKEKSYNAWPFQNEHCSSTRAFERFKCHYKQTYITASLLLLKATLSVEIRRRKRDNCENLTVILKERQS